MMKATALIKMRMMVVCRLSSDRRNDDGSDDATLPSTSSDGFSWWFVVVMSTAVMVVAVVKLFRVNLVHSFHELIWFRFRFESTGQSQTWSRAEFVQVRVLVRDAGSSQLSQTGQPGQLGQNRVNSGQHNQTSQQQLTGQPWFGSGCFSLGVCSLVQFERFGFRSRSTPGQCQSNVKAGQEVNKSQLVKDGQLKKRNVVECTLASHVLETTSRSRIKLALHKKIQVTFSKLWNGWNKRTHGNSSN
ncbi:hypothetical protein HanLR1_Chr15g0556691 [Helianthus annuus]|nr:hypothetical protein HanLR1_Chr15g0556691 [Helianthus annuus]